MKPMPRSLIQYRLESAKLHEELRFLVVSDLHNEPFDDLLPLAEGVDAVLVPGDISNRYRQEYAQGIAFLRACARLRPYDMTTARTEGGALLIQLHYVDFERHDVLKDLTSLLPGVALEKAGTDPVLFEAFGEG